MPVNRDRIYDFYAKEAEYFSKQPTGRCLSCRNSPASTAATPGHWGNQNEDTWADGRWNQTDLGTLLCGVFRGAGVTVPKGVCVRLGERGELAACFNPETLCYEAVWNGGFVQFSNVRHGLMDGLILDGTPLPSPRRQDARRSRSSTTGSTGTATGSSSPIGSATYRIARRPLGRERPVHPQSSHRPPSIRSRAATHGGGPPQWPQVITTRGTLGRSGSWPYVIDTIEPPFDNPWKALMFFGGHDFLPDGTAMLCTMPGRRLARRGARRDARARPLAPVCLAACTRRSGLVVADGKVYVLGRDQITRLHDLDGDGEADFYECFSNAYATSTAGHDFICGLQRDAAGRFYTASSKQGVLRISADGRSLETLATGFRNPDGLGLAPDGTITVPNSEGEWTPASMICEIRPGGHYGYHGPKNGRPPDLPLVYLPRGLDNSSGGQVTVPDDRFGPLAGPAAALLASARARISCVLREKVDGQPQGAVVPLPGEFLSGVHRGRFNPADGQLYVSGMTGWGTYTPADGCFQRVRYTGGPVQLPTAFHAHENGVLLTLLAAAGSDRRRARRSPLRPGVELPLQPGLRLARAVAAAPGPAGPRRAARSARRTSWPTAATLFLEIPDLQPVNQLHLHLRPGCGRADRPVRDGAPLAPPFTGFPGYRPSPKTIAAHPILADMAALAHQPVPNRWRDRIQGARTVTIEAGKNLSYTVRSFDGPAGRADPADVPQPRRRAAQLGAVKPGTLARVGDLVNKIVAEPDAASRHYIPRTDDVLVYTDIVGPQDQFSISLPCPQDARPLSLSLHVPRPLDGHERRDDREVSVATSGR